VRLLGRWMACRRTDLSGGLEGRRRFALDFAARVERTWLDQLCRQWLWRGGCIGERTLLGTPGIDDSERARATGAMWVIAAKRPTAVKPSCRQRPSEMGPRRVRGADTSAPAPPHGYAVLGGLHASTSLPLRVIEVESLDHEPRKEGRRGGGSLGG
jgi:hypothetical protein